MQMLTGSSLSCTLFTPFEETQLGMFFSGGVSAWGGLVLTRTDWNTFYTISSDFEV